MAVSCYRPVGRAERWIPPRSGYQPDLQALLVAQDEAQLLRCRWRCPTRFEMAVSCYRLVGRAEWYFRPGRVTNPTYGVIRSAGRRGFFAGGADGGDQRRTDGVPSASAIRPVPCRPDNYCRRQYRQSPVPMPTLSRAPTDQTTNKPTNPFSSSSRLNTWLVRRPSASYRISRLRSKCHQRDGIGDDTPLANRANMATTIGSAVAGRQWR